MNIKKLSYDTLSVYLAAIQDIDRSRRERERKTVAALARHALSDCGELCHLPSGAPYVRNVEASISISHSRQTAALAVGLPGQSIGVDIESPREQLLNVASRVLSERELAIYGSDLHGLLAAWTLKEATYKAAGVPGLDFRRDILLPDVPEAGASVCADRRSFRIATCTEIDGEWLSLVYLSV